MIKTFTQDDVIRYVYNETTAEENEEIENALVWDTHLAEFYQDVVKITKRLDKTVEPPSPKQETINRILQYSASFLTKG
jgi:hypothetical protein